MIFATLILSCAARHDGNIADLGSADLAGPIHDVGPFGCALPLEVYCAQNACIGDLTAATADAQSHCPTIAYTVTCRDDVMVSMTDVDSGPDSVYDRATGELVAEMWHANGQAGCSGGPTEIDLTECGGETWLCPRAP